MPDPNDQTVQDWKAALPEDLRGNESLASLKDVGELAKGYLDLNTKVAGAIVPPTADAKPEEVAAFYAKLGRPETEEKYELKAPPLPEGITNEETKKTVVAEIEKDLTTIRGLAFELGLTQKQAEGLVAHYGKQLAESHKSAADEYNAGMAALKTEWGKDAEAKLDLAAKTVQKLGGEPWFLNHPALVKFFANLGPKFAEDGTVDGKPVIGPERDAKANPAGVLYPNAP